MGTFIKIASLSELPKGAMKKYNVRDVEILLARIEGKIYAVNNKCPHFGGDLSRGSLEGTIVTCPRHGSQFNLTDGAVVRWLKGSGLTYSIGKTLKPPRKLITYNTRSDGESILVEI
jgi:3-phenylpropionate/trans-cinnamate dioxygenase ferredoxin subunit